MVLALLLAVLGGGAISHMIQTWYATIFRAQIHGWKAMARRVEWQIPWRRVLGTAMRLNRQHPVRDRR